jgi:hypothetical protein
VFVFNTSRVGRHIAGLFVENMNPDVTPYRMLLDVSPKLKIE